MGSPLVDSGFTPEAGGFPFFLDVELHVTDRESLAELLSLPEGPVRDDYAMSALRIGLLAMKNAKGQVDGDIIRREGDHLLSTLENKLSLHAKGLSEQLTAALKDYFDPESGRFHERVQRLIRKDGELEEVLKRHLGPQDSELCRTLAAHVGIQSPLLRLLSPKESEGLLKALADTLAQELEKQRKSVLAEFTLDNKDGALTRLVMTLTKNHGDMAKALETSMGEVVKEFSLDHKDSALSRLVNRVTKAQRRISSEFSLDNETSALSRMAKRLENTSNAIDNQLTLDKETSALSRLKRELLELLNDYSEKANKFHEEVRVSLTAIAVKRSTLSRTPEHGKSFQQQVFDFLQSESQKAGDIAQFCGDTPGLISKRKVGDVVIELAPECVAAGAKIVFEAKDEAGYPLAKAREEIDLARRNRGACNGVFVYSKTSAPDWLEPFQRIGDDVFLVWDCEDSSTDSLLRAGLMVARALCVRQARHRDAQAADFTEIEKAINEIEKKAQSLEEIKKAAETITGSADKILDRVRISKQGIDTQVLKLRELVQDLRGSLDEGAGTTAVSTA